MAFQECMHPSRHLSIIDLESSSENDDYGELSMDEFLTFDNDMFLPQNVEGPLRRDGQAGDRSRAISIESSPEPAQNLHTLSLTPEVFQAETFLLEPEVLYQLYLDDILEVFPDICLDYAKELFDTQIQQFPPDGTVACIKFLSERVASQIIEKEDSYPKESAKRKKLKRKRSSSRESDSESDDDWRTEHRRLQSAQEIVDA